MDQKSNHFSIEDAMALAESPAAQQLLALLQQTDQAALQNVISQASQGDLAQASQSLSKLLTSPEAKDLMKQLGG